MNRLIYNGITFNDSAIMQGNVNETKSPLTDTLTYDTLDVDVLNISGQSQRFYTAEHYGLITADNKDFFGYGGEYVDLRVFQRGANGEFYHDALFLGKFYIASVDRKSRDVYTLHFVSALGILDTKVFKGGVYTRSTAGAIINEIMGGTYASQDDTYEYYTGEIPYAIQKTLKTVEISGWIPYCTSSRDALQQLLFGIGGSVLKTDDGTMAFAFWQPTEAFTIEDSRLYIGGSINYQSKATHIVVNEHEFRQTSYDKQVELYDSNNITVADKLILFDKPCHTFSTTGTLTVSSSGANYAVVSGMGTLVGKEYTHNITTVEKDTGVLGDDNTITVTDAYLVSALNSYNVAERLSAYYGYANIVNYDIVQNGDLKVGDRVKFTDPFGEEVTGYISSTDLNLSNTLKATSELITNWLPNHTGNVFNHYTILSTGTSWNLDTDEFRHLIGTRARVVIFGGFQGGQGGGNGANGGNAYWDYNWAVIGGGGAGGAGGVGGNTVNINTFDIESLASSYNYTLGTGGAGGTVGGGAGQLGTDSTFNGVSSASGQPNTIGWANPIDGTIYGGQANNGTKGGNGGSGGYIEFSNERSECWDGANGQNAGTHTGGQGGSRLADSILHSGGGGGGASTDANGSNGTSGSSVYGGNGGNGASVTSVLSQALLGQNGIGGSGAGGGGGAGLAGRDKGGGTFVPWYGGTAGTGGTGQAGQQGSTGFILVMHN